MYCTGTGVVRNLEEAVRWYRRSAEQGDRYAQYNFAIMLLKGQGAPQDAEQAFRWCCEAAEQGLAEAQLQLGDLYREGHGVGADPAIARAWYQKAAEQGTPRPDHGSKSCATAGPDERRHSGI
jgi:TPR repeat protein